jgi:hypothetical protein
VLALTVVVLGFVLAMGVPVAGCPVVGCPVFGLGGPAVSFARDGPAAPAATVGAASLPGLRERASSCVPPGLLPGS